MENIILIVVRALGSLGEKGVHFLLDKLEAFFVATATLVDNELFYKAVTYIKSWQPKNPPVE